MQELFYHETYFYKAYLQLLLPNNFILSDHYLIIMMLNLQDEVSALENNIVLQQ